MIKHYFVIHQILEVLLAQRILFEIEIEGLHGLGRRLVIREVQLFQVGMRQGVLDGDPLLRVVRQHLLEQVDCVRVGPREVLVEVLAIAFGQLLHKFFVLLVVYFANQA